MGIMTALSVISQRKKTTAFHDQLIQLREFLYEADKNGEPCGSSFAPCASRTCTFNAVFIDTRHTET